MKDKDQDKQKTGISHVGERFDWDHDEFNQTAGEFRTISINGPLMAGQVNTQYMSKQTSFKKTSPSG